MSPERSKYIYIYITPSQGILLTPMSVRARGGEFDMTDQQIKIAFTELKQRA